MRVQILFYDGYQEMDALGVLEVLRLAAARGGEFHLDLVRLGGATVTSANGLHLHVGTRFEPGSRPDLLVLPGCGWVVRAAPGSWAEAERGRIGAVVTSAVGEGAVLAAVGNAALFLAATGFLDGRRATSTPEASAELRLSGAEFVDASLVDDGDLITSGGVTGGFDVGLRLVERFAGTKMELEIRERLRYRWPPEKSGG